MGSLYELQNEMLNSGLLVDNLEHGDLTRCKTTTDKGGQKSGWYRLFDEGSRITCVFGDWRTGTQNVWMNFGRPQTPQQYAETAKLIELTKIEREIKQQYLWTINKTKLNSLWANGVKVQASNAAGKYLINRGLNIPETRALRFHPSVNHWHDKVLIGQCPALLSLVTSFDGGVVNIQTTFLTNEGRKADVPTVKKLSPAAGSLSGSSIKIGAPTARQDGSLALGVAEGLETALAASMLFGLPVWSAVCASGLKSFAPPQTIKNIYIFGDNDISQVGQNVSQELGERLMHEGHVVRVHIPEKAGTDWADVLLNEGASHV